MGCGKGGEGTRLLGQDGVAERGRRIAFCLKMLLHAGEG